MDRRELDLILQEGETHETEFKEALELYLEVEKDAKPLKFIGVEKLKIAG